MNKNWKMARKARSIERAMPFELMVDNELHSYPEPCNLLAEDASVENFLQSGKEPLRGVVLDDAPQIEKAETMSVIESVATTINKSRSSRKKSVDTPTPPTSTDVPPSIETKTE